MKNVLSTLFIISSLALCLLLNAPCANSINLNKINNKNKNNSNNNNNNSNTNNIIKTCGGKTCPNGNMHPIHNFIQKNDTNTTTTTENNNNTTNEQKADNLLVKMKQESCQEITAVIESLTDIKTDVETVYDHFRTEFDDTSNQIKEEKDQKKKDDLITKAKDLSEGFIKQLDKLIELLNSFSKRMENYAKEENCSTDIKKVDSEIKLITTKSNSLKSLIQEKVKSL